MRQKSRSLLLYTLLPTTAFVLGMLLSLGVHQKSSVASPLPASTLSFQFNNNLKFGDQNNDVRQLQILLNTDPSTAISSAGVGSPGNESTFFGSLTQNAVIRFQEKYSADILVPQNLTSGTGFVGFNTRTKLNNVLVQLKTNQASQGVSIVPPAPTSLGTFTGATSTLPLTVQKTPILYSAEPFQIMRGATTTLAGVGFLSDNTLYIGSTVIPHLTSADGSTIVLTIPATMNNGTYTLSLQNASGNSSNNGPQVQIVITDTPQALPTITAVTPLNVVNSSQITITGTGFTPSGNTLYSGFGTIQNLSSADGTHITFSASQLSGFTSPFALPFINSGQIIPIQAYIANTAGVSATAASFKITL